ncbi:MAG: DUF3899 domain-containing protein [Oscillospiraceae bacterium]|nr:DUF3899 domain-containing protein [Oscillospiraceae bacterium]
MSKEAKIRLLKYGASALICAAIVVGYALGENVAEQELVNVYRILSDAFTLPALLFLFSGALVWLSNQGSLDAIGYLLTAVVRFIIPGGRLTHEKYGDYVARRREKNVTGYGFLFIVGLACMVGALVFTWLYFQLHGPI